MKTTQMRTNGGNLFTIYYSKRVSHHRMHLAEIQRQAEEWKSFTVKKEKAQSVTQLEIVGIEKLGEG